MLHVTLKGTGVLKVSLILLAYSTMPARALEVELSTVREEDVRIAALFTLTEESEESILPFLLESEYIVIVNPVRVVVDKGVLKPLTVNPTGVPPDIYEPIEFATVRVEVTKEHERVD
jgi:hypothetical protein